ncbi:MAG: hypothetical protein AAGH15_06775, partial [Myxococcota bacterium]
SAPTLETRPAEPAQLGLLGAAKVDQALPAANREAARAALRAAALGGRVEARARGQVTHVLSHRRLFVEVFRATGARALGAGGDAALEAFDAEGLDAVGISRLTRKILAAGGFGA